MCRCVCAEDDSPGEGLEGNKKVYYLFARADRLVWNAAMPS